MRAAAGEPDRGRLAAWGRLALWWLLKTMSRVAAVVLWDCRVFHRRRLPRGTNYLLAPNHQSFLDPWLVGLAAPGVVSFLARENLFAIPGFGPLIRALNALPLNRAGAASRQGLEVSIEALRRGRVLLLFPEGTRSRDGELQPLKRGIAIVASQGGRPTVPVYVEGSFGVWPKGQVLPGPGRLSVRFGVPIASDGRALAPAPAAAAGPEKSAGDLQRLVEDAWLPDAAPGAAPGLSTAVAAPPAAESGAAGAPDLAPAMKPSAAFLEALGAAHRALEHEAREWRTNLGRPPAAAAASMAAPTL